MTPTKNLWYGFGKTADDYAENSATNLAGKKVNICITSALHGKGQEVNYMLIDTIGGTKITKQNSADYMNNMSYEYVGNYFVPQG